MADIVERERATCDTLSKAYSLLTQLDDVTRYTFTPDKADLVNNLIDNIFEALRVGDGIGDIVEASAVPKSEAALPGKERAQRAYIRGKALDAKEGYDPEAEVVVESSQTGPDGGREVECIGSFVLEERRFGSSSRMLRKRMWWR